MLLNNFEINDFLISLLQSSTFFTSYITTFYWMVNSNFPFHIPLVPCSFEINLSKERSLVNFMDCWHIYRQLDRLSFHKIIVFLNCAAYCHMRYTRKSTRKKSWYGWKLGVRLSNFKVKDFSMICDKLQWLLILYLGFTKKLIKIYNNKIKIKIF